MRNSEFLCLLYCPSRAMLPRRPCRLSQWQNGKGIMNCQRMLWAYPLQVLTGIAPSYTTIPASAVHVVQDQYNSRKGNGQHAVAVRCINSSTCNNPGVALTHRDSPPGSFVQFVDIDLISLLCCRMRRYRPIILEFHVCRRCFIVDIRHKCHSGL